MRDAELLDRALAGQQAPSPRVAELVTLARTLEETWAATPSRSATRNGLARALDAFQGDGKVVSITSRASRARRFVTRTAIAVAALVALPGIARAASSNTLPGDLLYPVKLGFENLRLALADDPAEEAAVLLTLSQNRLEEAVLAEALRRPDAEREAVRRYRGSIVEFRADLGRARALGLDVAILVSRADALLEQQNEVLATLIARPPDPAVRGIRRAIEVIERITDDDRGRPGQGKADKQTKDKKPNGKPEKKNPRAGGAALDRGRPDDPGRPSTPPSPRPAKPDGDRDKAAKTQRKGSGTTRGQNETALERLLSDVVRGRTPSADASLPGVES